MNAPGWIIVPAVLVLVLVYLGVNSEPRSIVGVAWQYVAGFAGLAAVCAIVWWAGSMLGVS